MSDRGGRQAQVMTNPEQLFYTLQAANAGAWDWNIGEDRLVWPDETFAQFGLDPAKGVPSYKDWLQRCVHQEDRERVARYISIAFAGRTWRSTSSTASSILNMASGGSPHVGASSAISRARRSRSAVSTTGQKDIEEKLRKSEERLALALALKASSTGVWEWDCLTDAVTWSKECYDIHRLKKLRRHKGSLRPACASRGRRTALGNLQ